MLSTSDGNLLTVNIGGWNVDAPYADVDVAFWTSILELNSGDVMLG